MTIKEMIKELEEWTKEVGEDANVVDAEGGDVISICDSADREKEIVIYF